MTKRMLIFGMIALGITFIGEESHAGPDGAPHPALPQGLSVQGRGSAHIEYAGKQLTITPAQPHTLIHETSFNVGAGHNVHHVHASADYTTIHSVQTPTPSQIAGTISATSGNVVLVNPYGIAFADGARIDVPGHFIASTHGMTSAAEATFLSNGRLIFDGPSHGDLIQSGNLTFSGMGLAFISPFISQQGIIVGRAHALNTDKSTTITVDFMDRRFNFGLSAKQAGRVAKEVVDKEGDVVMTAGAVDEMLRHVSPSSRTAASGLQEGPGGTLYLLADEKGGQVLLEGTIDLSSGDVGSKGSAGSLQVAGEQVHVTKSARIFAKGLGEHHAGNLYFGVGADYTTLRDQILKGVASGTNYVGISNLRIDDGAVFDVSAQGGGTAGAVYFVSQKESLFGAAQVNISSAKGQGGLIDFSGLGHLRRFEQVNITSAISGNPNVGTVLLDPAYIKIAPTFEPGTQTGITHLLTSWVKETLASSHLYIATTHVPGRVAGHDDDTIEINDLISWASNKTLSLVANKIMFGTNGGINMTGAGTLNLRSHATKDSADSSLILGAATIELGESGILNTFTKGGVGVGADIIINGPADHYSLIYDRADLAAINTNNATRAGKYALANDITIWADEGDDPWTPIGSHDSFNLQDPFHTAFMGKFTGTDHKGGAHKIKGLFVVENGDGVSGLGLFGATQDASISDLVVEQPLIRQGIFWAAPLIGIMNNGRVERVHVTKPTKEAWDVEGSTFIGGLVGELRFGTISDSSSQVNVRSTADNGSSVGGLVGYADRATITRSHASGKVGDGKGTGIGGLVGAAKNTIIELSYTTGAIHGSSKVGGLVGAMSEDPDAKQEKPMWVENVYSTGNVRGGEHTAALIGEFGNGGLDPGGLVRFAQGDGEQEGGEEEQAGGEQAGGEGEQPGGEEEGADDASEDAADATLSVDQGDENQGESLTTPGTGDESKKLTDQDDDQDRGLKPDASHIDGQETTREYNPETGETITTYPDGTIVRSTYNPETGTRETIIIRPDGTIVTIKHNPETGETIITHPDGKVETRKYNPQTGETIITCPDGTIVTIKHNPETGETIITRPDGKVETRKYNPQTGETIITRPDGTIVTIKHNPETGETIITHPDGKVETHKYNPQTGARQVRITTPEGREEIYLYTPNGERLPIKRYNDKGEIEEYTYDENYQLRAKTVISGTKPPKHSAWENGEWKPLEVKFKYNTPTSTRQVRITTPEGREEIYLYTPNGKSLPIKRYNDKGEIEEYTYDENYQPLTRKVTYGTNPPANFEWKDGGWQPLNGSSMASFAAAVIADDDDSTAASRFASLKNVTAESLSGDDIKLGLEAIAAMPAHEQKAKIAEILKDVDTEAAFKTIIETVHELVASGLHSNPAQVNVLQNVIGLIVTSSSSSNPMIDFLQKSINNPQVTSGLAPLWDQFGENLISQSSSETKDNIVGVLHGLAG